MVSLHSNSAKLRDVLMECKNEKVNLNSGNLLSCNVLNGDPFSEQELQSVKSF